jgi:hypothetical protein
MLRAAALSFLGMTSGCVLAADRLGLYIGGAAGRSNVEAATEFGFSEHHSAFEVMAGIRPIPFAGAEVEYFDLGHPIKTIALPNVNGPPYIVPVADVSMKGEAAFGVLYLPLRIIDVYAKAGVAYTHSKVHEVVYCAAIVGFQCPRYQDRTDTSFAAGGGVQVKLGPFALRGEYERFNAAGAHPSLWAIGATCTLF